MAKPKDANPLPRIVKVALSDRSAFSLIGRKSLRYTPSVFFFSLSEALDGANLVTMGI